MVWKWAQAGGEAAGLLLDLHWFGVFIELFDLAMVGLP